MIQIELRRRIAIYSSIMSLFIVSLYNVIRSGLEFQGEESLAALGFAWFLFNLPILLTEINLTKIRSRLLQDEFVLTIILLLVVCLLGWISINVAYFLAGLGLLSFIRNVLACVKRLSWYDAISIGFVLFISIWFSMKVWEGHYLHPMLLEIMPFDNKLHMDTWFHVSMTQMIKTYQIPSTGINGIPFIHYHFGSHLIFASVSNTLDIHAFTFYQLVFPVVFIPLFMKTILGLPVTWAERHNQEYKIGLWFWLILTFGLIGIFSGGIISNASAYTSLFMVSESYCVSLILFFLILHLLVAHFDMHKESIDSKIVLLVFIPLLICLMGISKISTLFMFNIAAFYLVFRLKLYQRKFILISLALIGLFSLGCFFVTLDQYSVTEVAPFHFFKTFVKSNALTFVLVYYFWSILLIIALFLILKFENQGADKSFLRILLETVLIICFVGFIPGAVLTIHGGSAGNFMDIQFWLSMSFILIILPRIINLIKMFLDSFRQRQRVLIVGMAIVIVCSFVAYRNFRYQRISFLQHSYQVSSWLAGKELGENLLTKRVTLAEVVQYRKNLQVQIDSNLRVNPDYHALRKLFLMDTLSLHEKSRTALVLRDVTLLSKKYPCNIFPFMIPALTGMTFKNGYIFENCVDYNYFYEYYSRKNLERYQFEKSGILKDREVDLAEKIITSE